MRAWSHLAGGPRPQCGQTLFIVRIDDGQALHNLGKLDHHIRDHAGGLDGGFLDFAADDLFFNVKGRLYGYTMILVALRSDFSKVITERQIDAAWAQMLDSLRVAAALDPVLIVNGPPDGLVPSHLMAQGFYLLRARTQLREITNILLK